MFLNILQQVLRTERISTVVDTVGAIANALVLRTERISTVVDLGQNYMFVLF